MAVIVAVAVAARVAGLGSGLTVDEAYSWLVASSGDVHLFLHRLAASENSPPLFYLAAGVMPGDSPPWLRAPAALPGVCLCLVTWRMLRPRLGAPAALLAALVVAVDPYLITYSDLARGFMLADLALLVTVWMVIALGERESTVKWVVFGLAATVSVYTEYSSAMCLVALVLTAAWVGAPRPRTTVALATVALVTLVPWIP